MIKHKKWRYRSWNLAFNDNRVFSMGIKSLKTGFDLDEYPQGRQLSIFVSRPHLQTDNAAECIY